MGFARSKCVKEGEDGFYHTFNRCVRRAFLHGFDKATGRDFSHRKKWILQRLRFLSAIFAIDVCAYAILENHYHLILRVLASLAARWSDREVARRWLTLCPRHRDSQGAPLPPSDDDIRALTDCPDRIAKLRKRLCSLSWFMGQLNQHIALAANKEDGVKGRFWESRFKCQALLDYAAILACMVYVDLNIIRAGLADSPETSDFSSIQERILAWQRENMAKAAATVPAVTPDPTNSFDRLDIPASWLCPIQSDDRRSGILPMTVEDYIDVVDRSARIIRADKRGAMDPNLAPILQRIGVNPDAWGDTISRFGSNFRLAAGLLENLRGLADRLGRRWLIGVAAARAAFVSPPPQPA